ncbi:hypothetical protein CYMTET_36646 [Cymbomonas tetramitiformis]|uniref:OTU domain-containing protein n=1 Tax=Cymbomonas tetramitiformis TaxID=36881 RepID=A0AAE0CFK5_9CHLO|nr:hypothetical protein CYMTET_36646 [Cymbomonas tetramitiformis]
MGSSPSKHLTSVETPAKSSPQAVDIVRHPQAKVSTSSCCTDARVAEEVSLKRLEQNDSPTVLVAVSRLSPTSNICLEEEIEIFSDQSPGSTTPLNETLNAESKDTPPAELRHSTAWTMTDTDDEPGKEVLDTSFEEKPHDPEMPPLTLPAEYEPLPQADEPLSVRSYANDPTCHVEQDEVLFKTRKQLRNCGNPDTAQALLSLEELLMAGPVADDLQVREDLYLNFLRHRFEPLEIVGDGNCYFLSVHIALLGAEAVSEGLPLHQVWAELRSQLADYQACFQAAEVMRECAVEAMREQRDKFKEAILQILEHAISSKDADGTSIQLKNGLLELFRKFPRQVLKCCIDPRRAACLSHAMGARVRDHLRELDGTGWMGNGHRRSRAFVGA